ncbi:DUF1501 domain-containing protein [Spongiibacter sp. KMU-158]|uniref:DUF1501 domain-containing protein n=1 Tax=Spongiibacter pelagi TaxID=2760804 RepID=A0A927C0E0_9GAMM|nr:DUF1501 domain-containing protein [Spongiibacter pelagi]MBD2857577.1 DUF1501 domain-containing protein [Spongiibacter pelagi]
MTNLKRRQFLNMLASAGAAASLGGTTSLFPSIARAQQVDDYKAMVVLFLLGGNDSFNMMVPLGDGNNGYETYALSRGAMAINNLSLNPALGQRTDTGSNPYLSATDATSYTKGVYKFGDVGLNGMMPEVAQLITDRRASIVANMGTLVEPVSKDTLKTSRLPPFLYAHNHQQRAMETGWADNLNAGGWAGRLADMWGVHNNAINNGSPLGINISYAGARRMLTGDNNSPVILQPGSTQLFPSENGSGFSFDLFAEMNRATAGEQPLSRVLKAANRSTISLADTLALIDPAAFDHLTDPYGNVLFTSPTAQQLNLSRSINGSALRGAKAAAEMIKLGNELNLGRQIIFIGMGGFDNHSGLLNQHPLLLREISLAMWSFQQAMDSLGLAEQVTMFTLSDFGRTLGNNGDGTDHAWAGHNLLVGGDVNGGAMIGEMPDMRLGGESDTGSKGRMIPTIAIDQYLATLCNWFGVTDEEMPGLFPNLANFKSTPTAPISSAYVPGMLNSQGTVGGSGIPIIDLLLSLPI